PSHAAPAVRAEPVPRTLDPALAAVTFDSAWRRVRDSYYDPGMRGVDWSGVRDELRPLAVAARTPGELRAVIQRMLDRLGESHFSIIPGDVAERLGGTDDADARSGGAPGDVGLELRLVDGRVTVTAVAPDGPAHATGVRPGWTLDVAAGDSAAPALRSLASAPDEASRREIALRLPLVMAARLSGPAGSMVRVTVRDLRGRTLLIGMARRRAPGMLVRFGNLPPTLARVTHRRIPAGEGGCVGYVRFDSWMVPLGPAIESAVDEVRACGGIVLDLRGNLGGVAGMVMGVAGIFMDEPHALGVFRTRAGEARFVANPRRVTRDGEATTPFAGPVAVIVDGLSASTTEFFAAGMRHTGRARIFGETTAGKALPAALVRLPTGDVLMHVVADFTAPDGTRLEGAGVSPDVPVPVRRADLVAGRDAPLEAAVEWIRSRAGAAGGAAHP
ncbi:MAG TPA: S41 family peptidase, partial [Gemmatimonadales bacterium]